MLQHKNTVHIYHLNYGVFINSEKLNADIKGVISVFRSKTVQLDTTRSWDFMGLAVDYSQGTPSQLAYGDNIIVGVFDTGISSCHVT